MKKIKTSIPDKNQSPETSRLIVKNIPKTLDELSLRKMFEVYGSVTDCQIIFKGEVNRQFAFIGFHDLESAKTARQKMDSTFIRNSKVSVDFAVEKTPFKKTISQIVPKKPTETTQKAHEIDEKRLYITNLPYSLTTEDLSNLFSKYGEVENAKIIEKGGQSCGYGFITFKEENSSIRALHELDKKTFFGRPINIEQCRRSENLVKRDIIEVKVDAEKSSFKKLKKQKMLDKLNDEIQWNSSFLNPNTILERISDKLGVSRKDLLDNEIENPAVIKTICEKEILDEVFEFLSANNVNVTIFKDQKGKTERSKTTIMVKNLPYKTKLKKIEDLFSQYGKIELFLMAPNRAIAIVEYSSPDYASNAFKILGDYVYLGTPLYLEWAPVGVFLDSGLETKANALKEEENENEAEMINEKTVYIKNLNIETSENDLEKLLIEHDFKDFKYIKIVKKEGKSMGYGFVEFESVENSQKMIKKLQNYILQNHALKLSVSKQKSKEKNETVKDKTVAKTDKLIVKNLPFQTNKQEFLNLIKGIVDAKSIRLPQKTDGSLKGFAFVQFGSIQECNDGFEALQNLHFYGRKLVLEFGRE